MPLVPVRSTHFPICVRGAVSNQAQFNFVTQFVSAVVIKTMKSSSFGAAQTAAGLSRTTLMRPFSNLVENLKRMGVQYIVFHSNDGQDHQIHLSTWREEHVFQGIRINGKTLCPNVTSAFLNPFLPQPILVVTCDIIELPERKIDDNEANKVAAVVAESVVTDQPEPTPFQAKVHPEVEQSDKSQPEKKKGGSSCHQCKNVKAIEGLVFCQRKFDRRHRNDKRNCRKKYCPHCLMKFYTIGPEQFSEPEWFCPSCSGICRCAACARQSLTKGADATSHQQGAGSTLDDTKPDDTCVKREAPVQQAPNLSDALELQGQFSNFTHSSPTSSDENNEMLNVPSAGAVVEISSTAGENLSNSVIDDFRPNKRLRSDDSNPSDEPVH